MPLLNSWPKFQEMLDRFCLADRCLLKEGNCYCYNLTCISVMDGSQRRKDAGTQHCVNPDLTIYIYSSRNQAIKQLRNQGIKESRAMLFLSYHSHLIEPVIPNPSPENANVCVSLSMKSIQSQTMLSNAPELFQGSKPSRLRGLQFYITYVKTQGIRGGQMQYERP
jgi:hypothetical protein